MNGRVPPLTDTLVNHSATRFAACSYTEKSSRNVKPLGNVCCSPFWSPLEHVLLCNLSVHYRGSSFGLRLFQILKLNKLSFFSSNWSQLWLSCSSLNYQFGATVPQNLWQKQSHVIFLHDKSTNQLTAARPLPCSPSLVYSRIISKRDRKRWKKFLQGSGMARVPNSDITMRSRSLFFL